MPTATRPSRYTERLTWRVIRDRARPGTENMSLDHALAACLCQDEAVLRLYSWARPTVSFGRNEPARGLYSKEAAEAQGIDYVRRPTGGRAVLHDAELTYSVVAPPKALGTAREAYVLINELLASALRFMGAPVGVARSGKAVGVDFGPCFQTPVKGEVMLNGRKLIGSAQARVEGVLLQHGSIVLDGDQSRLDGLRTGDSLEGGRPATLREALEGVEGTIVADRVIAQISSALGGTWLEGGYSDQERQTAARLGAERYTTHSWTWRR